MYSLQTAELIHQDMNAGKSSYIRKAASFTSVFQLHGNKCYSMWGAYIYMDAYKRDVAVVIKICAYIDGYLFQWVPIFYSSNFNHNIEHFRIR